MALTLQRCSSMSEIEALTQRIADLETGANYQATQAAVQAVEQEFLLKLREIREEVAKGSGGSDTKELAALQKENEELRKRNAKLEYRVRHLVASVNQLYPNAEEDEVTRASF